MKKVLGTIAVTSMLGACATYDPYTGEKEASKASIGAGIGAGVAAVIAYTEVPLFWFA